MAKKKSTSKKEKSYERQIRALLKISESITNDQYLEDILKLIVTVTAEVMGSKICSLMLLNEEEKELVIKATQSVSDDYIKKPNIKVGEGIAGRVVQLKKPIAVLNVTEDEHYKYKNVAKKEGLCSLLAVPLFVKGKVIGVLYNYTSKPHRFTRSEINILVTVANQAAVAIENTRLLVKSKIIQQELENRKFVEKAKGILMKEQGLSEHDAFKKIQKTAMDTRRSMREIAEAIILSNKIKL